ncbi:hypothetical protein D3C86_1728710 [compost metagenome]
MVWAGATFTGSSAHSMASAVVSALITIPPPTAPLVQLNQPAPFHCKRVRKRAALDPGAWLFSPFTASRM